MYSGFNLQTSSLQFINSCADPENFLSGRGGGGGVQIPRRGLTENFNMAKINNLATPLDPPMQFFYYSYEISFLKCPRMPVIRPCI